MLYTLAGGGEELAQIAVVGGLVIALTSIIMGTIKSTSSTKQREQTKREVAAYIAEGSMTPEQGERIIAAGKSKGSNSDKCC
jgi:hypothetical protein